MRKGDYSYLAELNSDELLTILDLVQARLESLGYCNSHARPYLSLVDEELDCIREIFLIDSTLAQE